MTEQLPRIFFDTNAALSEKGYVLWFDQSRAELSALGDGLREGLKVVIYMPDELEMQALLAFDEQYDSWVANVIEGTICYLDGSEH